LKLLHGSFTLGCHYGFNRGEIIYHRIIPTVSTPFSVPPTSHTSSAMIGNLSSIEIKSSRSIKIEHGSGYFSSHSDEHVSHPRTGPAPGNKKLSSFDHIKLA
jgi:hypothetical protein